jgi:hypothetical protein
MTEISRCQWMPVPQRRRRRTPRRPHTCHARLDSRVTSYSRHATVSAVEGKSRAGSRRHASLALQVRSLVPFVSSTAAREAFAALVLLLYFF